MTTDNLNLRAGPGTVYPVVGQVSGGNTLLILARNEDGSWLEVETPDGARAWISAELVETSVQSEAIALAAEIPPLPTATPTPENLPKVGHWEGSDPPVEFNVTEDGNLHDFKLIIVHFGWSGRCTPREDLIVVDSDGTFNWVETHPAAEGLENHLSGKFESRTTVTGTYQWQYCLGKDDIVHTSGDPPQNWSAEWTGPLPTPTPTPEKPPRPGKWQGDPSVTFTIGADGHIYDFEIVFPVEVPGLRCSFRGGGTVHSDGTFTIIYTHRRMGDLESRISGKFENDTTVAGTYIWHHCEEGLDSTPRSWSAQWVGP